MRLMEPSPGEIWDRLSILDLKIAHSDRQEFKDEHRLLREYYDKNYSKIPSEWIDEITKINSRLWELEDEQRQLINKAEINVDSEEYQSFTINAFQIVHLNDARAETVRKINVACGIDSVEKLHDTNKNS